MKRIAILLLMTACFARAITFNNEPSLLSHTTAPDPAYAFYPWSSCVLLGGQGVFSNVPPLNGALFGDSVAAVWPVGPQAFVSALHINDFRRPGTEYIKWEKIRFLGTDYHIANTYIIANDTVLYTITNTLPMWHQTWRGPYTQNEVTCLLPGVCFTNTVARIMTNIEFMAVLPGALGNVVCADATLAPQAGWGYATNYVYPNSEKTINYASVNWALFQERWNLDGFWGTQPMLFGGSVTVNFTYRSATFPAITPNNNFGARTGDSGGGLFARERGAVTGAWKFVGIANNGGYCQNSPVEFSVIDLALGWDPQYWAIVGQPQNAAVYAALKTNYVQSGYSYTNCPTLPPIPPSTEIPDIQPPPPPPNVPPTVFLSTPTNGATLTNVPITITATAADSDGTVSEVRFYDQFALLSITNGSPYTYVWSPTNGAYTLNAIARDNSGAETTSTNISVTVNVAVPPPPPPAVTNYPTVSITTPTNGFTLTNASYVITVAASQTNGTLQEVRVYDNGTLVGIDYASPFTFIWSPTNGTHLIHAVARNVLAVENSSSTNTITVNVRSDIQPLPPPILLPAGSDFDAMLKKIDELQDALVGITSQLRHLQLIVARGRKRNDTLATNLIR